MGFPGVQSKIFAAVLIAAVLSVGEAHADFSITLFEHKDFRGQSLTYSGPVANLSGTGLNDRVSSVKVVPGQRWLLCKDKKFRGGCIVVDRDLPDLAPLGFNDRISSLKPVD